MQDLGIDGIGGGVEIGRGGNAVVFSAQQIDLGRDVAVKMLQIGHDEGARRRFDRERRLMAKLQHPNIAPVLDSGYSDRGEPYLIMPLYDTALDELGEVPWPRCVDLMRQVSAGVGYAHDKGVLHRDLKPANIMLDGDRPVVLDFGIATLSEGAQTRSLALRLTPAFAPPEAFEAHEPTPSLDVYGLGATLHALLRGRPPFTEPGDSGLWPVIERVQSEAPTDLRDIAPSSVCEVIERAMAKSADDRQPTVAAFGQDLASAISPETVLVEAPRQPLVDPGLSWADRSRNRARLVIGVVAVAMIAAVAITFAFRQGNANSASVSTAQAQSTATPPATVTAATATDATATEEPTSEAESANASAAAASVDKPANAETDPEPVATPNAVERIEEGLAAAMQYIGVNGADPTKQQTCPGILGWCLGDPISDIEAALGPRERARPNTVEGSLSLESMSWALPSNNTFRVAFDSDGVTRSMSISRSDTTLVSLFATSDLGLLTYREITDRFGEVEPLSGLNSATYRYCIVPEDSTEAAYAFDGALPKPDELVDVHEVFTERSSRGVSFDRTGGVISACTDS